ncbi:MAG: hypothetical protein GTN62_05350 [Gemmatimonadales bacterium]|nr:hypothetical protein [Gemmatimonadales bacterium]NIN10925.1 hypothetical protein [Gemmatimonadales bacterium]NIN49523.1 hypothetical protein [Gemmatimonadales bacterium]NIP06987.1 hypothetical protein [Gemmatimonadales bacterium]NIS63855.1 hypothetical protein [Gemmatimonadales bacterium]
MTLLGPLPALAQQQTDADAAQEVDQWSVARDLVIGEPPDWLTTVSDLLVAADGSMYVVQQEERLVRKFASDGELTLSIGRRGRGPGEFLDPRTVGWLADTLMVADWRLRRISAFSPSGDVHYTITTGVRASVRHLPLAVLTNGRILAEQSWNNQEVVEGRETVRHLLLLDREGATVAPFADLAFGIFQAMVEIVVPSGPTLTFTKHPFSNSDLWDVDPEGSGVVVVTQADLDPDNPQFSVTRLAPSGREEWNRSFRYTPQPVTDAMARDTIAAVTEMFVSYPFFGEQVPHGQIERAVRKAIRMPSVLAPVSAVVAGRDGTTWIRREAVGEQHPAWMVLDEQGVWIAQLRMPAGLRVHQADRHHVWGVELDELDAPRVVRYRVRSAGER